jgi:hypothetical protein
MFYVMDGASYSALCCISIHVRHDQLNVSLV